MKISKWTTLLIYQNFNQPNHKGRRVAGKVEVGSDSREVS